MKNRVEALEYILKFAKTLRESGNTFAAEGIEESVAALVARHPEAATPAAVVIVDAAGNSSVVLDSKFRAALTTGEHVLFARGSEGVELSKERKLLAETAMWLSEIINTAGDTWDDERDLELLPRIGEIAFKQAEKIRAYMNSLPSQEKP